MIDQNNAKVSLLPLWWYTSPPMHLRTLSSGIVFDTKRCILIWLFAQDELDLVLRRDAVSVEAIYFSRSAAMSAAAGLSGASLLDKTPKVTLKVADC